MVPEYTHHVCLFVAAGERLHQDSSALEEKRKEMHYLAYSGNSKTCTLYFTHPS